MEGHAKKCVERYCELANKSTHQLYKVSTPCIDDHHFKEEEMKSVGEVSQVCSQNFRKCFYLARIGRPDILWSVNRLARSITKWTKACDKRLKRLISHIHHTCECRQCCLVGNTAKQCRLGLFQDSDVAGDLEDSKSTSGGTLCVFGSHTFVPIGWMCKKQTAVSHSSTESEIISLDTGLRLDGLLALEIWDLIVSVLGNVSSVSDRSGKPEKPSPPGYSKEDYGQSWSSQEWKSGATTHDRSGQPDKASWRMVQQVRPHHEATLLDGDATEFVNRVNDEARKRQKRMSNVAGEGEEHSIIWGLFMAVTMNAATFMGGQVDGVPKACP